MKKERAPQVPEKSRLTWRIAGLRLDSVRRAWIATGFKADLVSVIVLPHRDDSADHDEWLKQIEAAFEAGASDPTADGYLESIGGPLGSGVTTGGYRTH